MQKETKEYGTVYAVLKSPEHLANKSKMEKAEYFRYRHFGANIRVDELGDGYTVRTINVKYTSQRLKSIEAVVRGTDHGIYAKVPFYDDIKNAKFDLNKAIKKFPSATVLSIPVVIIEEMRNG